MLADAPVGPVVNRGWRGWDRSAVQFFDRHYAMILSGVNIVDRKCAVIVYNEPFSIGRPGDLRGVGRRVGKNGFHGNRLSGRHYRQSGYQRKANGCGTKHNRLIVVRCCRWIARGRV